MTVKITLSNTAVGFPSEIVVDGDPCDVLIALIKMAPDVATTFPGLPSVNRMIFIDEMTKVMEALAHEH